MLKNKIKALLISGIFTASIIVHLFPSTNVQAEALSTAQDGLVARWTFDENYTESVSGLTTNLGAKDLTYTDGIYGKAAVFNGESNYLYVDANPILNFGNSRTENNDKFSISAWVNLGDSKSGDKFLLDKGLNKGWGNNDKCAWSNPYKIRLNGCEVIVDLSNYFQDGNSGVNIKTNGTSRTSGGYLEGEEWVLLTVTYDGTRVSIYQDNELLKQNNYANGITFNDDQLFIGVDYTLKNYFKGAVDDLRLYNKTLSYEDVDALYQAGLAANKELVEPTKQLVAYYPFDGDLTDLSKFKNNAEMIEMDGTSKYEIGKNGKAVTIAKGNYISVPAATQLNPEKEFTISFWVKAIKTTTSKNYPLLYRLNPSNIDNNDNKFSYKVMLGTWSSQNNSDLQINTLVYNPGTWQPGNGQELHLKYLNSDTKLHSYDWVHYTVTYKNGELKNYLNGVLKEKANKTDFVSIENASGNLLIGYDGKDFLEGSLDELKIYNYCLAAADVKTEANRVDSISLSKSDAKKIEKMDKGSTFTISSILLNDVDEGVSNTINLSKKNITFKSSNEKIFTVSEKGVIEAVKAGEAKLTITYGCHTKTYTIKVD